MNHPFEPDSIKDKILMLLGRLGGAAWRRDIVMQIEGKCEIVHIAIDSLIRDNYLLDTEGLLTRLDMVPEVQPNQPALTPLARVEPPKPVPEKRCKVCELTKPITEFHNRQARCKACFKIYASERYRARAGKPKKADPEPAKDPDDRELSLNDLLNKMQMDIRSVAVQLTQLNTIIEAQLALACAQNLSDLMDELHNQDLSDHAWKRL